MNKDNIKDGGGRVLTPQRRFIYDIIEWEEALEWVHVVPAIPLIIDDSWTLPAPGKSHLKDFDKTQIRYDVNHVSDPNTLDRGRLRFPNLNVREYTSSSRTASPPPRPDDPNKLREENRRRRLGLRTQGPPCKEGIS